jgi:hypothetical protein
MPDLPAAVRELQERGLEIRECEDLGPFKKLIPALETFPDAFVVTADDDVYYSPTWLASLAESFDGRSITCLRADRIIAKSNGETAPYMEWEHNTSAAVSATDLLPVGVQGVLYPPGALGHSMNDRRFLQLCRGGDDLWYFAMASLAGTPVRKVGPVRREILWSGSQQNALWKLNGDLGGNDRMINAIQKEFGRKGPFHFSHSTER